MAVFPGALQAGHNPENTACNCEQCNMTWHIVRYMLFYMEPTDRALRLPPKQD